MAGTKALLSVLLGCSQATKTELIEIVIDGNTACKVTCDFLLLFQDLVNLLPVEGLVQGRCRLWVELQALTQLLQHSCLGRCCVQSATGHLLS